MNLKTINKLCCPFDHADLALEVISRDLTENVIEGILTCSRCSRFFPIIRGIPIMSPDEYREFSLEKPILESWNKELKDIRYIK